MSWMNHDRDGKTSWPGLALLAVIGLLVGLIAITDNDRHEDAKAPTTRSATTTPSLLGDKGKLQRLGCSNAAIQKLTNTQATDTVHVVSLAGITSAIQNLENANPRARASVITRDNGKLVTHSAHLSLHAPSCTLMPSFHADDYTGPKPSHAYAWSGPVIEYVSAKRHSTDSSQISEKTNTKVLLACHPANLPTFKVVTIGIFSQIEVRYNCGTVDVWKEAGITPRN